MVTSLYLRVVIYTKMTGLLSRIWERRSFLAQFGATDRNLKNTLLFRANQALGRPLSQKRSDKISFFGHLNIKIMFLRSLLIQTHSKVVLKPKVYQKYPNSLLINWMGFSYCPMHHGGIWQVFVQLQNLTWKILPLESSKKLKFSKHIFTSKKQL